MGDLVTELKKGFWTLTMLLALPPDDPRRECRLCGSDWFGYENVDADFGDDQCRCISPMSYPGQDR